MDLRRKNTLSLNFSEVKEKVTPFEIHMLIKDQLKFKVEEVVAIEIIGIKVFVKLSTEDRVKTTIEECGDYVLFIKGNERYKVPIKNENALTTVRVHHIPVHLGNEGIIAALSIFGNVVSIRNETWGKNMPYPVPTGVRALEIKLTKPVPSYVNIYGRKTLITYIGQKRTCKFCQSEDHMIEQCPSNKQVSKQMTVLPLPKFVTRRIATEANSEEADTEYQKRKENGKENRKTTDKEKEDNIESTQVSSEDIVGPSQESNMEKRNKDRIDEKKKTLKKPKISWNEVVDNEIPETQYLDDTAWENQINLRMNPDPLGLSVRESDKHKNVSTSENSEEDMDCY